MFKITRKPALRGFGAVVLPRGRGRFWPMGQMDFFSDKEASAGPQDLFSDNQDIDIEDAPPEPSVLMSVPVALTALQANTVVVDAVPAKCPDCPPEVSCAPCNPWACPPASGATWVQKMVGGKMTCQRPATSADKAAATQTAATAAAQTVWYQNKRNQAIMAIAGAAALLIAGAAVAYVKSA